MSSSITGYRVLIERPDGLEGLDRSFSEAIHVFNESEAVPRNVLFIPVAWEPGAVPSHGVVSEELQRIDYLVFVLWDRLPPDGEAKYELAMECLRNGGHPLAQVVPFFTAVPPRQMADPGRELARVLEFKRKLESTHDVTFENFDGVDDFAHRLRRHLSQWLIRHEQGAESDAQPYLHHVSVDTVRPGIEETIEKWERHPLGDTPDAFNEYGLFLQREGMLDEAVDTHQQALERSKRQNELEAAAVARGNLGVIYHKQGKTELAEGMFKESLAICESLGWQEGMAACYTGLGLIAQQRYILDRAEDLFLEALGIERSLGRDEGMAACYHHLGLIYDLRGEPVRAEEARRLRRAIRDELEYPRGDLFPRRH